MNETTVLAEMKLADLSAYLVARYGMTPRDATGLSFPERDKTWGNNQKQG